MSKQGYIKIKLYLQKKRWPARFDPWAVVFALGDTNIRKV